MLVVHNSRWHNLYRLNTNKYSLTTLQPSFLPDTSWQQEITCSIHWMVIFYGEFMTAKAEAGGMQCDVLFFMLRWGCMFQQT